MSPDVTGIAILVTASIAYQALILRGAPRPLSAGARLGVVCGAIGTGVGAVCGLGAAWFA